MKDVNCRSQRERLAIAEALMEAFGEENDNRRYEKIREARKQLSFDGATSGAEISPRSLAG